MLSSIWQTVWPILAALLVFGFFIVTHEGGHFFFAKLFHVKVNEFSVGMGPVLLKKKHKETQYSLRLLPVGGYVAMEGEDGDKTDPDSFENKSPVKRAVIILAGGMVNLLTGVLLMAVLLAGSELIGTNTIADFEKGSVLQTAGAEKGDTIVSVNGHKIMTNYDLSYYMASDPDGVMDLVVERDGEYIALDRVHFAMEAAEDGAEYMVFDFILKGVEPSFLSVTKYAVLDSVSLARMVWDSLLNLLLGKFSMSDLSGPIGTVSIVAQSAESAVSGQNLSALLLILALIAINLGVFNLIPFPALDGGRFVFIMIEGIFRKPVSKQVQAATNALGMALLVGLMIMVTFSDVANLFS